MSDSTIQHDAQQTLRAYALLWLDEGKSMPVSAQRFRLFTTGPDASRHALSIKRIVSETEDCYKV